MRLPCYIGDPNKGPLFREVPKYLLLLTLNPINPKPQTLNPIEGMCRHPSPLCAQLSVMHQAMRPSRGHYDAQLSISSRQKVACCSVTPLDPEPYTSTLSFQS